MLAVAGLVSAAAFACSTSPAAKKHPVGGDVENSDPGDPPLPPAPPPDYDNSDSGAFTAPGPDRPRDAAAPKPDGSRGNPNPTKDAGVRPDASLPEDDSGPLPPDDSGVVVTPPTLCPTPLAKGDLAIVEMMIDSASGAGDRGEWVEIQNTRDCTLNLKGLRVESPRGTEFDYVDVTEDMLLAPSATFVVADTVVDSLNHTLPGTLLSWVATDALKNDGDTVSIKMGTLVIDELTYGTWGASYPGRSLSFSVDCAWTDRLDWARWTWSDAEWMTGFKGTPNADNADVKCF